MVILLQPILLGPKDHIHPLSKGSFITGSHKHLVGWCVCPSINPNLEFKEKSIVFFELGLTQTKGRIGWKVGLLDLVVIPLLEPHLTFFFLLNLDEI